MADATKIAICNMKGGSGKSTTSVLTALAYASQGYKTLLADFDPQGGTSVLAAGKDKTFKMFKTTTFLLMNEEVKPEHVFRLPLQLDLLPSNETLDRFSSSINEYDIKDAMEQYEGNYDCVVLDCPPTMEGLTAAAVSYANKVIVPTKTESPQDFRATQYAVKRLRKRRKKPGVLMLGYREYPEENMGYHATLCREFHEEFGNDAIGYLPRSVRFLKAAADTNKKWTKSAIEKTLKPIFDLTQF